jgi:hypothetical protein
VLSRRPLCHSYKSKRGPHKKLGLRRHFSPLTWVTEGFCDERQKRYQIISLVALEAAEETGVGVELKFLWTSTSLHLRDSATS